MDIVVALLKPRALDNGDIGLEWTAVGRLSATLAKEISGVYVIPNVLPTLPQMRDALRSQIRVEFAAIADVPIPTTGRFVVMGILG